VILTIHRGAREIGGSCVELRTDAGDRLILDLGMPLANSDGTPFRLPRHVSAEHLLEKGVLPRIEEIYKNSRKPLENTTLIISHAHQDHYGLAGYVRDDLPKYATAGTFSLLEVCRVFLPRPVLLQNTMELKRSNTFRSFTVNTYPVDHSAPDAVALSVHAEGKTVVYTGDLRAGGRRGYLFERLLRDLPHRPDVLLMEGTMVSRPEPPRFRDEEAVKAELERVFKSKNNVAFLFCSGQNISRLVTIYMAVRQAGHVLVIDPYVAFVLHGLRHLSKRIPQFDWKDIYVFRWRNQIARLKRAGESGFVASLRRRAICTPDIRRQAKKIVFLARTNDTFPMISGKLDPAGIEVIWSMWEGYWENDRFVRPFCEEHGIREQYIHAGGHAAVPDLQRLAAVVKPKRLVPIHTTKPEDYTRLFADVFTHCDGEAHVV
jgi:ribonuclease J